MQKQSMGQNTRNAIDFLLVRSLISPLVSQFMTLRLVYQTCVSTRYSYHPDSPYCQWKTKMGVTYSHLKVGI